MRKLTLKLLLVSLMVMPVFLTFGQTEILNEAFDDGIMPPPGWTIDPTAQLGNWGISTSTHAGGESPQGSLDGWPSFIGTTRLISPVIDASSYETLELEFKYAVNSATYGTFSLKIETTSDGGVTWNEVWSVTPTGANSGTTVPITISNGDLGSASFQFCYNYSPTAYGAIYWSYFDDFILSGTAPVTCFAPTALAATNITSSGADLSWTPTGTESLWNLEYGVEGFTPGSGTLVSDIAAASYAISGLDQGVSYDYYVQANCGDGDLSAFSDAYTFMTTCAGVVAPAWSEGFENAGAIPACWEQGSTNPEDWIFATSASHVGYEGIITGSTVTNSYFAYVDNDGSDGITTLESPFIDVSALTAPMVEFYLISDNEGFGNVNFEVYVYDGTGWNQMLTSNSNTINGGWEYKYILLDGLTITGDIKLRFLVADFDPSNYTDDVAIDDVSVQEAPGCPSPINSMTNNITPVAADLDWTAGTTETNWDIEWGVSGFTPGTGTLVNDHTSTTLSLSALDQKTLYDWYIRADCGANDIDVSAWVGPITFTTIAYPMSGAYTINSASPSGGTNFNNFADFVSEINLGGLTGPVTVEVVAASGPYNEQVILGEIENSSATNTISINGNGEKLEYLSTTADQRATLKLDGTDYFTLDNLVIEALGSVDGEYGFAAHLVDLADYNTFTNCEFIANMTSTSAVFAGFVSSTSHTSANTFGLAASNLTVQNCKTSGGYYGMIISGPSEAPNAQNAIITGNEIQDFYNTGLLIRGQNNAIVSENEISRPLRTNASSATYMVQLNNDLSGSEFTKNRMMEWAPNLTGTNAYGINGSDLAANPGEELLIANNTVSGFENMNGHLYGIYLSTFANNCNLNIYHNTVLIDNDNHGGGSGWRSWVFYHTGSNANLDVRNNIFSLTALTEGADYCIRFNSSDGTVTSDNNVLHAAGPGTNNIGNFNGNIFLTLADWQTANGGIFDQNSSDADPEFLDPSVGNLIPTAFLIDNIGADLLTIVPDDIMGTARTATPDPGAYEFVPPTCIKPTLLPATGMTTSSAFLEWVDNNTPAATMWDIEVVLAGTTPTGTPTVAGVTANPYEYTGLSGSTAYDWYVRSSCGGGDYSYWTGPETFITAIGVYPYVEDFETFTTGTNATGYTNNWTTSPEGTTSAYRWNVDAGGTPSSNTGPTVDHTTGTATGIYIHTEASSAGAEAYLYSPVFDLTAFPTAHIGFWYHMVGSSMGELHLDITTDGGVTWVDDIMTPLIGAQQSAQADPYLNIAVSLSSYVDQTVQFRFRSIRNSSYGDMAIDDVSVYSGYTVSGNVTYANTGMTALDTCIVEVRDAADAIVRTITSDAAGYYEFIGIADGDYTIVTSSTTAYTYTTDVGDLNVDIDHVLGTDLLGVYFLAGDVDGNMIIDVIDANLMIDNIVGTTVGYPIADWLFENQAVNVNGANATVDYQGIMASDADGSWTPAK